MLLNDHDDNLSVKSSLLGDTMWSGWQQIVSRDISMRCRYATFLAGLDGPSVLFHRFPFSVVGEPFEYNVRSNESATAYHMHSDDGYHEDVRI